MKIVREEQYDLVVCGGGMSGFATAVSAARKGLSVALVERTGCLGGTATSAGVNHLLGGRKINEKTNEHVRVVGGLFDELALKIALDDFCAKAGVLNPDELPSKFLPV